MSQSSYDKLSLAIVPLRQWLRMPEPLSAYKRVNGALIDDVARRYAAQAVALADPAVNFSGVDIVYIVPNPEATAYPRSSEHDYPPEEGFVADGRVLLASVTFGTAVYERGYRTLAHETSHTFGLYDYYNAFGRPTDRYAGAWSLMADSTLGADHFAWDKWRMGWLADTQIRCITGPTRAEYVLSPLETPGGVKALILRTGLRSAVVAEYRTRQGLDAGICSAGILIYKVNSGLEAGAGPIRVSDARPRSASGRRTCGAELDDAAFGRSGRWTDSNSGLVIVVTYLGRAARIHVTRTKPYAPPVRYERSIAASVAPNDSGVTVTAVLAAVGGFAACTGAQPISLQEYRLGAWWTTRAATTDAAGGWTHMWMPSPGAMYRLHAPQRVASAYDCAFATSSPITIP
jgi:M6 family metalloprotease-like protein